VASSGGTERASASGVEGWSGRGRGRSGRGWLGHGRADGGGGGVGGGGDTHYRVSVGDDTFCVRST
jgi:hypothetical protein